MGNLTPILVALVALALTYTWLADPLRKVPGPFRARFSRLWMVHRSRKGDMHTTMIALHKKHGHLVRTAPNEVSISDPAALKTIYGAGTKFWKSDWYSVWQGHRTFDLFGERNEKVHGRQRRLVSNIYSLDQLRKLEPYVDSTLDLFLERVREVGQGGKGVDMGKWAQMFAFDVIGEVTFSRRFGFLSAGKDDGSFSAIDDALLSAAWIGQVPWLYWLHDFIMPVIGNYLGVNNRNGSLRQFAARECENRKGRGSDHRDILAALKDVQDQKPEEFDDNGVLSMAASNIFAGSDTTGISIGAVLYNVCKDPRVKEKLVEEIRQTIEKEGLDATQNMPFKTGFAMPYLQAVIYEALRMHPAVGMTLPRVVPAEGFEYEGVFIPAGTIIGANPWVIHRQKEVFGEDCEAFRPERWLEGDRSIMDRNFFAFGSGARGCIGRNLSWIEITKLVPSLLMQFDIELADPERLPEQHCWWFVKQDGLDMKLTPREKRADSPVGA
ncbi:cytochrome P450 [Dothidotthia symphoricarpi CBS 119687]|uniref:Cytochrome P450 n=1 Tax=Dothidotthia symphoricarpi CBS 119687 TaxID=1392245 RepID=A0A6A5ZWE5_9PLEO|nr:cytochrome P450 [Dothidotthia symphoricarpi CBS 119687]KAF2123910.1 cytochrome P450 [Dothidotthia symphoricarpi CBS 119687]